MKNWEFYEKELKKYNLAFALKNNQIYGCAKVSCGKCAFNMGESRTCDAAKVKWLYQEYKKSVILTEDEKSLCKLLGKGWIARDANGCLWWYEFKPRKYLFIWMSVGTNSQVRVIFSQYKFDFIRWEDEEPWEIKIDDEL